MKPTLVQITATMVLGNATCFAAWPQLDRTDPPTHCNAALEVATSTFRSTKFVLHEAPVIPAKIASFIVLSIGYLNPNDLQINPRHFEVFSPNTDLGLYWQRRTPQGSRAAIRATTFGWRGNQYELFALAPTVTSKEVLSIPSDQAPYRSYVSGPRPPIIFYSRHAGGLWVLDVNESTGPLSDWTVYSQTKDGFTRDCIISFAPKFQNPDELVPEAVGVLRRLLDETLGPGLQDGTLNSTAGLRMKAAYATANAALRPWAIPSPRNTKAEVDRNLLAWARASPKHRLAYDQIRVQYPVAESALHSYYLESMKIKPDIAQKFARHSVQSIYTAHYVFPKGQ